jgi:hypothetical protein
MATYSCENCGSPIEVRPRELVLVCRECGYEQRLSGVETEPATQDRASQEPAPLPPAIEPSGQPLEPIAKPPSGLRIDDDGYRLRIRRRWFNFGYIPMLFFCIAWDSFLVFWYSMAFGDAQAPWIMIVFPIGHVAVGVGLTYFVLAGLLNTTTLTADRQKLAVRHRPIPWSGNLTIESQNLRQLYVKRDSGKSKSGTGFALFALLQNQHEVRVWPGIETAAEGKYVEREVERHLGIAAERVKGESKG